MDFKWRFFRSILILIFIYLNLFLFLSGIGDLGFGLVFVLQHIRSIAPGIQRILSVLVAGTPSICYLTWHKSLRTPPGLYFVIWKTKKLDYVIDPTAPQPAVVNIYLFWMFLSDRTAEQISPGFSTGCNTGKPIPLSRCQESLRRSAQGPSPQDWFRSPLLNQPWFGK